VLTGVSFEVAAGEVYALTGANGSGKTTLIRLVTGLAFPDRGEVLLLGKSVHREGWRARRELGALVEAPAAFYPYLTGRENLERLAWMSGIDPAGPRVREVLTRLELLSVADQKVASYSLGQRQRLGLAAALLARPKVLVLDEPTSGLDPEGVERVHRILAEEAKNGAAVLVSTHHLREISAYAHKVGILGGGRLVDEVRLEKTRGRYRLFTPEAERAAALLKTVFGPEAVWPKDEGALVFAGPPEEAVRALVRSGVKVRGLEPERFDLYEYYRERVGRA